MEGKKSWVFLPVFIRNYPLGKSGMEIFQGVFFFSRKFGKRKRNVTRKDMVSYSLPGKWGTKGRPGKLSPSSWVGSWDINLEATFRSMESFQTNKQTETLKHKMTCSKCRFYFCFEFFTLLFLSFPLKNQRGSDVVDFRGLRATDALGGLPSVTKKNL